ncbi:phage Gp37/Gp68 family protein [Hyphomonas sp.]|uniref:phage Gp37/Gp68 family protein n=1 Tax=Hyphomonas sp. TaxID=87 RepID=UPI00391C85A4
MAEETRIEWADHTFNPWIGCTKVSPACDHCYAEAQASRYWPDEQLWAGKRKRTSANNWRQPLKWNRQAAEFRAAHGRPPMVFCASLADVFDNQVPDDWRRDLWALIEATPDLIWLLLTKRPQNIRKMLPMSVHKPGLDAWGAGWPNVWLGTTVENQAEADRRIPHLLAVPAAKRFLSCEPLLGPVDLDCWPESGCSRNWLDDEKGIDWVIAGGESGPHARPSHPDWFRGLRDQCAAAGVPFFFKRWGEWSASAFHPGFEDAPVSVESGRLREPIRVLSDGDEDVIWMSRAGKKAAGRMLDGVIHDARPEVRS